MTATGRIALRRATADDVPTLLELIRGIAEYERLAHEVVATEAALAESLFKKRAAEVILAFDGDRAVGFAVYFHNFSTFLGKSGIHLEDVFVIPQMRGRGFGKALLKRVAQIAVERNCGRLEWAVLDWNELALRVYRGIGARAMNEWTVQRLTGDALNALAASAPAAPRPSDP